MNDRLWNVIVDSFPKLLEYGLKATIPLTILSFALALVIAVAVALIQYANVKPLLPLCRFYIWLIRGTPLLVQLYVVFYVLPEIGIIWDAFPVAVIVFGFNEGAYMAETIRGSLESVSVGQLEAGYCVGLNYIQTMWHVVLPQAFRTAFPALSNSLISMVKGTSLASTITVREVLTEAKIINGRVMETGGLYILVAVIYLPFCTLLTWLQHVMERRLARRGGAIK